MTKLTCINNQIRLASNHPESQHQFLLDGRSNKLLQHGLLREKDRDAGNTFLLPTNHRQGNPSQFARRGYGENVLNKRMNC